MYRFFVSPESIDEEKITITGETARHISRSLRMAKGELVTVCDGLGEEYVCRLEDFTDDRVVVATVISHSRGESESETELRLYQAYPKGDKLDSIVMKVTEAGASAVVPFISRRCVSRPDPARRAKIRERLSKIALGAAEQSHRSRIPSIGETMSFSEMLADAATADLVLFCYEGGEDVETTELRDILAESGKVGSISVIVGSEGGFDREEAIAAREAGALLCGLGKRILRCETASLYAFAGICCYFGL